MKQGRIKSYSCGHKLKKIKFTTYPYGMTWIRTFGTYITLSVIGEFIAWIKMVYEWIKVSHKFKQFHKGNILKARVASQLWISHNWTKINKSKGPDA